MKYYIVNAFSAGYGNGNPAGVVFSDELFFDEAMQQFAAALKLSETAFIRPVGDRFELRWFTPGFEINLCGHATLAAAYVILEKLGIGTDRVTFDTKNGKLFVRRLFNGQYEIALPKSVIMPFIPDRKIVDAIGVRGEYYRGREIIVCLENFSDVLSFVPDYERLSEIKDYIGVVITAPAEKVDFVSRYFCTTLGIEDPVTGSSHCNLVPIWSSRLGKNKLIAHQLSERGGTVWCENKSDCILLTGSVFPVFEGELNN